MTGRLPLLAAAAGVESRADRHDTNPATVTAADGTLAATSHPALAAAFARTSAEHADGRNAS